VVTTSSAPIAASTLSDNPGHGLYDGIVRVACGAGTGPDAASVSALDDYAAAFGVRSACLFAHGDPTLGLATGRNVDTGTSPVMLQYTAQGTAVFGWYATNAPVEVSGVAAALAAPIDATTTPLLVDQSGNAAVAIHQFADGHELMLLTFDQAPEHRIPRSSYAVSPAGWPTACTSARSAPTSRHSRTTCSSAPS
jgi:hypothetical protein